MLFIDNRPGARLHACRRRYSHETLSIGRVGRHPGSRLACRPELEPVTPVSAAPVSGPTRSALEAGVDGAISRALDEHRIVGAVVIVARDGADRLSQGARLRRPRGARPMRVDDMYRLASMTKPLVGVALLRLADRGVVDSDAPVTRWLPELRPRLADGTSPTITFRQLLTHTSGLGYRFAEPAGGPLHRLGVSDGMDASGITLDENLRRLSQASLLFSPGSAWSYSLGFDVLGRVIERVTNKDLETAMLELVTGPLGMKETSFVAAHPARLTTPYADGKPEPVRMTERFENPFGASSVDFSPGRATDRKAFFSGGAGMVGTANDYIRFLEAVRMNSGGLLKETNATRRCSRTRSARSRRSVVPAGVSAASARCSWIPLPRSSPDTRAASIGAAPGATVGGLIRPRGSAPSS